MKSSIKNIFIVSLSILLIAILAFVFNFAYTKSANAEEIPIIKKQSPASTEFTEQGLKYTSTGGGGYAVTGKTFSIDEFSATIKVDSFGSGGWIMIGFSKTQKSWNTSVSGKMPIEDYGVFMLIRKNSATELGVQVFIYRPGTGENYFTWLAGSFKAPFDPSKNEIKVRTYHDEFDRYLQLDINDMYLMNNRLRISLAKEMFGEDLASHLLIQTNSSSGAYDMTLEKINNNSVTEEFLTPPHDGKTGGCGSYFSSSEILIFIISTGIAVTMLSVKKFKGE